MFCPVRSLESEEWWWIVVEERHSIKSAERAVGVPNRRRIKSVVLKSLGSPFIVGRRKKHLIIGHTKNESQRLHSQDVS